DDYLVPAEIRLPCATRQLPYQGPGHDSNRPADRHHHLPAETEVGIRPEAAADVSYQEQGSDDDGDEAGADEPAMPAEQHLGREERDAAYDEREGAGIDGKHLEGHGRDEQANGADDAGHDGSGVEHLEQDADHA